MNQLHPLRTARYCQVTSATFPAINPVNFKLAFNVLHPSQVKSSQVFYDHLSVPLVVILNVLSYLRLNSYMSIPAASQCLSSFHLYSLMVLLCTVSCGRLFHSRGALIVKIFVRVSRFALRTTTALPLVSLSFHLQLSYQS